MILETKRLILREMSQEDIADLSHMLEDPRVMYAYEHDFTKEEIQAWLDRQIMRYQQDGFGLWAMILKSTGEMVGQAGLSIQHYLEQEVVEIGYLLKYQHWHHGYAREAAIGCKEYAFRHLHLTSVYSIIKADNEASIRVAIAAGMHKEAEFTTVYYHGEMLHELYTIEHIQKA